MKLLAIDGNSIINRAFYGIRLLSTKNGLWTNGIYGFMSILGRLMENEKPDGVAIAFDISAPTFRHEKYSEYKAGRKGMPDELRQQMPLLKKLLTLYGYTCIEKQGYEADDILGTLAKICENEGNTCVIATGDRDSFQLVSNSTKVLLSSTKAGHPEINEYTPEAIFEKYGVTPKQMIEIKALQGDSSDNIPGVAGVGEKTAGDLIRNFKDIDYIYENIDTLDIKEGLRAKLISGKESAFLSRELGTIFCSVPEIVSGNDYVIKKRKDLELAALLAELEFFKELEKLGLTAVAANSSEEPVTEYKEANLSEVIAVAEKSGVCDVLQLLSDKISLTHKFFF